MDRNTLAAAWTKATVIAIKFLDADEAPDIASLVGPKRIQFSPYNAVVRLYLEHEMTKETVNAQVGQS